MKYLDKVLNPSSCGILLEFTTAELNVNQYVKTNISHIDELTITELSKKTYTSRATIDRWLKKLGASGFKEFKTQIIIERDQQVDVENISTFYQASKFLLNEVSKIDDTKFVQELKSFRTKKVIIVGMGSSYISSQYLARRLIDKGYDARAIAVGESLGLKLQVDAYIFVSATGENPYMLEMVNDIQETCLTITKRNSRLHKLIERSYVYDTFITQNKKEQFENQLTIILMIEQICYHI